MKCEAFWGARSERYNNTVSDERPKTKPNKNELKNKMEFEVK